MARFATKNDALMPINRGKNAIVFYDYSMLAWSDTKVHTVSSLRKWESEFTPLRRFFSK